MDDLRQATIDWARKIPVHDLSEGKGLCRVIFAEDFLKALKDLPSAQPDWDEMLVICDCCGHAIHVKRL